MLWGILCASVTLNLLSKNTAIINRTNGNSYLKSGESAEIRIFDPLLAKHRIDFRLASENILGIFIQDKKNTKGLTVSGEEWLRDTVRRFLRWLPVPLPQANREHVVRFHPA